ncbi:MAG: TetR/AcrR family transcriptional regulator [bacterium]|nr:TetR/AcrR family transcriptional regulator [bacterium]
MARPKESERQDIRALVLHKAKKLFLQLGYHNITMRKIAEEIGYTPGTIYLYFTSKEEILYELHNEGFRLLYHYKMSMLDSGVSGALDRLTKGGKTYIAFALENPEYYEVMFNMPEPRDYMDGLVNEKHHRRDLSIDYAMRSYEFLKQGIQQCQEEGYLKGVDSDIATFLFWSTIHGIVSLTIRKRVPFSKPSTQELAEEAVVLFMNLVSTRKA